MARFSRLALVVATVLGVLVPGTAASQWVEGRGLGWTSLSIYHQETSDVFGVGGARGPFPGRGRTVATSAFFTVATGLGKGGTSGPGALATAELRGHHRGAGVDGNRGHAPLRPCSTALLAGQLPAACDPGRGEAPGRGLRRGLVLIPLGDGQRDWELMLELGHSFYPRPIYVMAGPGTAGGRRESATGGVRKRAVLLYGGRRRNQAVRVGNSP